jgi:hypothetical protein
MKPRIYLVLVIVLLSQPSFGQGTQTPYSIKGIGDIVHPSFIVSNALGGTVVAYPGNYNFNPFNPALHAINSLTTFETSFTGEVRRLSEDTLNQSNTSGNLDYLALSFPVAAGKWTSGLSLMPYSYVNYHILSADIVTGSPDTFLINYRGSGGINSLAWSNGFMLFQKVALGFKVSYLFGSISNENTVEVEDVVAYKTALKKQDKIRDFNLSIGAAYRLKLTKVYSINLGGVYETSNQVRTYRSEYLERRRLDNDVVLSADTIYNEQAGSFLLPERYGLGFSLVKEGKWILSADYLVQDWSKYRNFENESENLQKTDRMAAGFEFIPDISSVNNYLKRIIYRAGASFENTPYRINDTQLKEIGINFGISLPVRGVSLINLTTQFGRRGSNSEIVVNESYFRFSLGFTYNDRWFIRRQID